MAHVHALGDGERKCATAEVRATAPEASAPQVFLPRLELTYRDDHDQAVTLVVEDGEVSLWSRHADDPFAVGTWDGVTLTCDQVEESARAEAEWALMQAIGSHRSAA